MDITPNSIVLITGASSGIGRATAELFAKKGWQVIATMRDPEKSKADFPQANVTLLPLDVTKPESIKQISQYIQTEFGGRLDVVINNAGFGLFGAFEQFTPEEIQQQYMVNVFGVMNMCREVIPLLRKQGSGRIITVSSMGGHIVIPYYGVYCSTKHALDGFCEGLWHELKPFNIQVSMIEPGAVNTDFYSRSMKQGSQPMDPALYDTAVKRVWQKYAAGGLGGLKPSQVAKKIHKAATVSKPKLRYPVGLPSKSYIMLSRLLPNSWWLDLMRRSTVGQTEQR